MNLLLVYKLTYLITTFGGLFILVFILFRRVRIKFNILYALTNISLIIWAFGRYMLLVVNNSHDALLWGRLMHIGSILVHLFFLHTILVFINKEKSRRYPLIFFYINSFLILSLNLSDLLLGSNLFLRELIPKLIFPWVEVPNGLYNLHLINELVIPTWAFFELIFTYLKASGIFRQQLLYIIISSLFGFIGGNSVVLLIYNIPIQPILVFFVPIHLFTMAYAIFKLRLMDIRLILVRTIAFGFILLLITAVFSVVSTMISKLFTDLVGTTSNIIAGLVIALLVTLFYQSTRRFIERVTNAFLYKQSYDPDVLQAKITEVSSSELNLGKLLSSICKILQIAFHCEKIGVAFLNGKKKLRVEYENGFLPGVAEKLVQYPHVVTIMYKQLKETPGLQVIDEMKTRFDNGEFKPVDPKFLYILHENDIAIIVPLYVKGDLKGVFVLGMKKSGDPYNSRDLHVINNISGQISIAIDRARLYGHLEELVVQRTEQLKETNKKLASANVQLKKLDASKSDFISIASHQLRTPLTAVKGWISMINDKYKKGEFYLPLFTKDSILLSN